jgi:hypothetical protein
MTNAAAIAKSLGFDIVNGSSTSELKCFRHGGLSELGIAIAA